jgi:transketolase
LINTKSVRRSILNMAYAGSAVHIGCAFSIVEILSVLYNNFLRFPENDCEHENRDYLILSKGHGVMAQYACMRDLGWLSQAELDAYFSNGSQLKGLSDSRVKGLEVTSGSLGHGLSVGVGMAFGAALSGSDQRTFAIVGDGEINEGSVWEALLFASHHQLRNLLVIVDANGFQAMGKTDEVIRLGNIGSKFEAFGFDVRTVDGHNEPSMQTTIEQLLSLPTTKPKALIANTIKGKGVSFMENNNVWHYSRLNSETLKQALTEIDEA